MDEIAILLGTLADLDTVVAHRIQMFRDMGIAEEKLAAMEEPARAYFRDAIPSGLYVPFLADCGGRIVAGGGIMLLHWPGSATDQRDTRPMILNMYTEPEFRRRGLARRLMLAMVDWCRSRGYHAVSLHASNEGRPLYESIGFRPTNELRLML